MRFFKYYTIVFLALLMVGCKNRVSPEFQRTEADAMRTAKTGPKDSTMFVVVNKVTNDSVWVTDEENSNKLSFSIKEAKANKQCHGTVTQNNRLAIMVTPKTNDIRSSVNITELQGLWLLSDKSGNGIRIEDGGTASNVGELQDLTLRSWRMKNGQLAFKLIKNDGSDYKEKEEIAIIETLSPNKLVMGLHGYKFVLEK